MASTCSSSVPALLQSTVKLLLWPTKALLRPAPRLTTLLASESPSLGMALCVKLLDARIAGSSVRVDVSLAFVTFTRRGPERQEKKFNFTMWCRQIQQPFLVMNRCQRGYVKSAVFDPVVYIALKPEFGLG